VTNDIVGVRVRAHRCVERFGERPAISRVVDLTNGLRGPLRRLATGRTVMADAETAMSVTDA
jgi:hypothetical protein